MFFKDETVWLTQKALVELFGVGVPATNKHLKNIFESGELESGNISKMEIVCPEGNREATRQVEYYNLDAIVSEEHVKELNRIISAWIWTSPKIGRNAAS